MMMAGSADTNQQLLGQESAPFPPNISKIVHHKTLTAES